MKYGQWCLAIGGVSVLLISSTYAQSAASCRKAEFRGGAPVFYYDKACMAKLNTAAPEKAKISVANKKPVVKRAKSSPKVKAAQKLLTAKGYNSGGTDGLMGPKTKGAINSYYKKNGLKKGSGSRLDAVLAHLKTNPKRKTAGNSATAKKKARVAAIKKAVAAKRAAAKKPKASAKVASSKKASGAAATAKKKARVAAIKKAVAAKHAAAKKQKASASAASAKKSAAANAAAAAKKNARVAAIKKAVAAKRAAAKNKKVAAVAPKAKVAAAPKAKKDANVADLQTLLKKKGSYNGAVDGTMNIETRKSVISYYQAHDVDIGKGTIAQGVHKHLKSGGSSAKVAAVSKTKAPVSAQKTTVNKAAVAAKKKARVAAIKKAVAAKRAAAKKKTVAAVAPKAKVAAAPKVKKDANVADLQTLLKKKGAYNGAVDGTMNLETRKSVVNYYHAHDVDIGKGTIAQGVHKHLKSGGSSKVATAAKVKAPAAKKATASKGKGNKVVEIQAMLGKKGLYSGKADGVLNAPTRKAILSYYKKSKVKRGDDTIINSVHKHLTAGSV